MAVCLRPSQLLVVLALVAAACAGADPEDSDTPPGAPPPSSTTTTVDSAAEAVTTSTTTTITVDPYDSLEVEIQPVHVVGFAELAGLTGGLGGERYVVDSVADRGPGTYRDALAESDRYITFAPSLDGQVITLESEVLVGGSNITIDASGRDVTVTGFATKFSGTNIVVAGMAYVGLTGSADEDAITFRDASGPQIFGLYGNTFQTATDGLVDVIWNRGNDVHGTMCGNAFADHDKAVLIHSGENTREGGRYHITMCRNSWSDVEQRAPLSRDSHIHQFNSVFVDYGKADGAGGGSKAGSGLFGGQHYLEGNIVTPRSVGSVAWNGVTVTEPRAEFAGTTASTVGIMRIDDSLLLSSESTQATQVERLRDEVFDPPAESVVFDASIELADLVTRLAGTCPERISSATVVPCGWPLLLGEDAVVEIVTSLPVDRVDLYFGDQWVGQASPLSDVRWSVIPVLTGHPSGLEGDITARATLPDGRVVWTDPLIGVWF